MNGSRFSILIAELPEDLVLAVLDALEASSFYAGGKDDDYARAQECARYACKRAPSPTVHDGLTAGGSV